MTGYGRVSKTIRNKALFMEMKSVNSRYLDVSFRFPQRWDRYEIDFSRIIRNTLHRGKISITAGITGVSDRDITYVNRAQVRLYRRERRLLDPGTPSSGIHDEFALQDITGGFSIDPELIRDDIQVLLGQALDSLIESRQEEGGAIEKEFIIHTSSLESLIVSIEHGLESMPEILSERLRDSLKKLGSEALPLAEDRERIAKEIAVQLVKGDFTEELSRMKTHLQSFRKTMEAKGPHGRHLEFILQEMQRELNTMTSKCSIVDSIDLVLKSRVIIEKMREQVANIE